MFTFNIPEKTQGMLVTGTKGLMVNEDQKTRRIVVLVLVEFPNALDELAFVLVAGTALAPPLSRPQHIELELKNGLLLLVLEVKIKPLCRPFGVAVLGGVPVLCEQVFYEQEAEVTLVPKFKVDVGQAFLEFLPRLPQDALNELLHTKTPHPSLHICVHLWFHIICRVPPRSH